MTEQRFLTTSEVCAALGVTRQTVVNLVKRGKLKKYKREIGQGIGGTRIMFDAQEVSALGAVTPAAADIGKRKARK